LRLVRLLWLEPGRDPSARLGEQVFDVAPTHAAVGRAIALDPTGQRHPETATGRQGGDDRDRSACAGGVGHEPGEERPDHEPEVAPEAIDTDSWGALDRLHPVGYCRDQCWVDKRRADAEEDGRNER
jgi:hypothetical protein